MDTITPKKCNAIQYHSPEIILILWILQCWIIVETVSNRCWLKSLMALRLYFVSILDCGCCCCCCELLFNCIMQWGVLVIILFMEDKTVTVTVNNDPSNLSQHSTTSRPLFNPSLWFVSSFLLSQIDGFCLHFPKPPCLQTNHCSYLLFLVIVVFCSFNDSPNKPNWKTENWLTVWQNPDTARYKRQGREQVC